jgi:hypothetical protein
MLQSFFFYLLLLLPAVMTLVALAVRWSSLGQPALYAVVAFLSLVGLQAVVRWATRLSLHNFIPISGIYGAPPGHGPSTSFLLAYHGVEALLLLALGTVLLLWIGAALAKA